MLKLRKTILCQRPMIEALPMMPGMGKVVRQYSIIMRIITLLVAILASVAAFSNVRVQLEPEITKFSSSNWVESKASSADIVEAVFMIKRDPEAVKKFEAQLLDLSSPFSKNYGKWLNKQQIIDQFAPSEDKVKTVVDYVASFGAGASKVRVSDYRDKVFVSMPVSVANKMLHTSFSRFTSKIRSNVVLLRTTQVSHL